MWNEYVAGRNPQPDLTNLSIYHEIGGGRDREPADVSDQQGYERGYTSALAYCDAISPVPRDCRLWAGSRWLAGSGLRAPLVQRQ
jgi:hypothetical protein